LERKHLSLPHLSDQVIELKAKFKVQNQSIYNENNTLQVDS